MALTKLNIGRPRQPRRVENEDVREALLRCAKKRWPDNVPFQVISVKNGIIKLSTTTIPWRAMLLWLERDLIEEINSLFGLDVVRRVYVYLD